MNALSIIIIVLATGLLTVLMLKTDLLKDESSCIGNKPYSLSKVQLALWSLVVFSCFVYLIGQDGFVFGKDFSINETALILLGISGVTTVIGNTIDSSDVQNPSVTARHQDDCSEGFWRDILSDKNGISIHRYQNVIFTAILLVAYIAFVTKEGKMPDWDGTVLTLMGISSAGYLGVKMNENK